MPAIIEWPDSQVCMDCRLALWLIAEEKRAVRFPALVCQEEHYPEEGQCSKRQDEWENQTVELVAAGYEWNCPACGEENKEIEIVRIAQCKACDRKFKVEDYEHAFE